MDEVTRYDGKLGHVEDGSYVSYEDYAALQQKLDAQMTTNSPNPVDGDVQPRREVRTFKN